MTNTQQALIEITALKQVFEELDSQRIKIEKRVRAHDDFISQLNSPEASAKDVISSSKSQKQSEEMADNPIYLVEIQRYLSRVLDAIRNLKENIRTEKKTVDKMIKEHQAANCTAACFAVLEGLDLPTLEKQINMLKGLEGKNSLIQGFDNDLLKLKKLKADDPVAWQELTQLGHRFLYVSLLPKDQERLMTLTAGHTDVSILSQWHQRCRLSLLETNGKEFIKKEKLHSLNTAIQDALRLPNTGDLLPYEDEYWDALKRLDKGFDDELHLNSLGNGEEADFPQWLAALNMIIEGIKKIEKSRRELKKKRNELWKQYLEFCNNELGNTARRTENPYMQTESLP